MSRTHRLITAMAALCLALLATPAYAHDDSAPPAAGTHLFGITSFTGTNNGTIHLETDYNVATDCSAVTFTGFGDTAPTLSIGSTIGYISYISGTCTSTDLTFPIVLDGRPGSWPIKVASVPSSPGDPFDVTIENTTVFFHSTGTGTWPCEFDLDGDLDGVLTLDASTVWQNATLQVDAVPYPLGVTTYDGNGGPSMLTCGGQIYTGDTSSMTGLFDIS